jgi:DNA (cytosine-5)-methyltransferase 1
MTFKFVDLFAGIGGFHAALEPMGGQCVFASDIDEAARNIYEANWNVHSQRKYGASKVAGDIVPLTENEVQVPNHEVLVGGFPCQPFSKSGYQRGMEETRGTLFWNILKILEAKTPAIVILENVRNIAGPRHRHEWNVIIRSLRDLGYKVSDQPAILSPHLLPPERGGTPQVRERVFITGTYVGRDKAWAHSDVEPVVVNQPMYGWNTDYWNLDKHLLENDSAIKNLSDYQITAEEEYFLAVWEDFLQSIKKSGKVEKPPGFPLWADDFVIDPNLPRSLPEWKKDFLVKNSSFYKEHRKVIDAWKKRHDNLEGLPASRRKFEWQAQDAASIWECVIQFRPSGIRVKKSTYLPALVAITQTSVIGSRRRRITPREAARVQGFSDTFTFLEQPDRYTYKQLGNAVCAGVVKEVFLSHISRDFKELPKKFKDLLLESNHQGEVAQPGTVQLRLIG